MNFINDKTEIIYSRQVAKNNISDIDWLRLRLILILNCVFIVILIPALIIQNSYGTLSLVAVLGVIFNIFTLTFNNFLIWRGYLRHPILITVIIIPLICFTLAFLDLVEFKSVFPQLCLLLAFNIWLLNSYFTRIFYSIVYFGLLTLLFYNHSSLHDTISCMFVILGYVIIFHVLTLFLEKQDQRIVNSLEKQKELNNTLANKNDELKTFSHIMSHDLKNPINIINSFSQIIKETVPFEDENHKKYFDFIQNSTHEMKDLIDELLLYHNVENGVNDFDKINLNDVINQISKSYQTELENQHIIINAKPLPIVEGCPILLKALFRNLISNSLKYQPKKATSHIPKIKLWTPSKSSDDVEIYFSDNGIGINEKYIEHLFTPFKRYHKKQDYAGTGLGMSICNSVMKKHFGSIFLHETSEKGTTFILRFPKTPTISNL